MGSDTVPPTATKRLEFINVSDPNEAKAAAIRTKVRKHVMKDIGRSRRRPKKHPTTFELILNPQCQLGSREIDPFVKFPIDMGPTEKALLSMIFRDVDNTQYAHRYEWFSVALIDEATFLLVLSNSAAHRDRANGLPLGQKSIEADQLYLQALQSINKRMLGPNPEISEGLIGAVSGLITHNDIVGNFEEWTVHVDGIEKLLTMRGGIDTISMRELRDTILYIELRGAFYQDIVPRFPLSATWSPFTTVNDEYHGTSESSSLVSQLQAQGFAHTTWPCIYKDLVHFSLLTQQESTATSGRSWLESPNGGGWPNAQIHRLLSWRPLRKLDAADSIAVKGEFLRLTSLFYLGILWAKFGVLPLNTAVYSKKLYKMHGFHQLSWGVLWPFEAWYLLIGAVGSTGERRRYFFEEIWALCLREGLGIDEVLRKAKEVMWIEDAFSDTDIYQEMTGDVTVVTLED